MHHFLLVVDGTDGGHQYAEDTYHLDMTAANIYQLNRAITTGTESGTFVLPKGPSGKVKLAPKVRASAAKEVCRFVVCLIRC
jgi:histone H1/5